MSAPSPGVRLRLAHLDDLPVVADIFNYYVARSTCTFQIEPDSAEERRVWFTERSPKHPVTVAVEPARSETAPLVSVSVRHQADEVIGWGAISPWKGRCAYAHSVEASVYVRHDHHRRGIGRMLLEDLIQRARTLGHHTIIGGACTEQAASLALQESLGFKPIGCFREVGYKFGRWLDVAYAQLLL